MSDGGAGLRASKGVIRGPFGHSPRSKRGAPRGEESAVPHFRRPRAALGALALALVLCGSLAGSASAVTTDNLTLNPGGWSMNATGSIDENYFYSYTPPQYIYVSHYEWKSCFFSCNYSGDYLTSNCDGRTGFGSCVLYYSDRRQISQGVTSYRNPYGGGYISVGSIFPGDPNGYFTGVNWGNWSNPYSISVPLPGGRWNVNVMQYCQQGAYYDYGGGYASDCSSSDSATYDVLEAPTVSPLGSSGVGKDVANVGAGIVTHGFDTSYQIVYGTTATYDHATEPLTLTATSNTLSTTVQQALSALDPGTTYHWALVATNAGGTTSTPDRTFKTDVADATPPVVEPTVSGTHGDNGWYTSDVDVTWSVSDPDSSASG